MFSCGDYISVHDGTDSTSPRLRIFSCVDGDNETVTSSRDRLYVHFVSDDQFQAQGFAASFRFISRDRLTTSGTTASPSYTTGTAKIVSFTAVGKLQFACLNFYSVCVKLHLRDGRADEWTDAGNRIWCISALKCDIQWQ